MEAFPLSSDSDHHILLYKPKPRYIQILYDFRHIATIETLGCSPPITSIAYDLGGIGSPFQGPITAAVHPNLSHFRDEYGPYRERFPPADQVHLYQEILASEPRNASDILTKLDTVRQEFASFEHSSTKIEWRGLGVLPPSTWTRFYKGLQPQSVCVIGYKLTEAISTVHIHFKGSFSLQIDVRPTRVVLYENERGSEGGHTTELLHSMNASGGHLVALINHGGQLHVSFDFNQSIILTKTTLVDQKLHELWISVGDCVAWADVHGFYNHPLELTQLDWESAMKKERERARERERQKLREREMELQRALERQRELELTLETSERQQRQTEMMEIEMQRQRERDRRRRRR